MQQNLYDLIVIGGGAAGFFAAINAMEMDPNLRIVILERSNKVLAKVRISGGGRCNVAHAEYSPKELSRNYPRGEKELRGPFHHYMTSDVEAWFEDRGVPLKTESDGRMFPVSNSSQTIIDCFIDRTRALGITVMTQQAVSDFTKSGDEWNVHTKTHVFSSHHLLVATGSDSRIWNLLVRLGHQVIPPVPSLFTFNIRDARIRDLPGIAQEATVTVLDADDDGPLQSSGPLLITHWGMSGPAILKLSAWGARTLNLKNYRFRISVNWLGDLTSESVVEKLKSIKHSSGKISVMKNVQFGLTRRLWQKLVLAAGIPSESNFADISKKQIINLADQLTSGVFEVDGKSTFKEEFVTAGGVDLTEINFKTFESKVVPGLFLAGEVLNIDAITGGFNFQNAWTGAFLAARALTQK